MTVLPLQTWVSIPPPSPVITVSSLIFLSSSYWPVSKGNVPYFRFLLRQTALLVQFLGHLPIATTVLHDNHKAPGACGHEHLFLPLGL